MFYRMRRPLLKTITSVMKPAQNKKTFPPNASSMLLHCNRAIFGTVVQTAKNPLQSIPPITYGSVGQRYPFNPFSVYYVTI